jgi:hypothetical protein
MREGEAEVRRSDAFEVVGGCAVCPTKSGFAFLLSVCSPPIVGARRATRNM